jgi:hypothetical protein
MCPLANAYILVKLLIYMKIYLIILEIKHTFEQVLVHLLSQTILQQAGEVDVDNHPS